MPRKPDGNHKQTERMVFTRPAAERISRAVRAVEAGDRSQPGISFGSAFSGTGGKVFRVCTFTGAWSKSSAKVVTFRGVTSTPNTVSATNLFAAISSAASSRNCAIARDGTAWYLIAAEC